MTVRITKKGKNMKQTFEKLWSDYFSGECAAIKTKEERELIKKAGELHERARMLLSEEQECAVERHMEAVYDMEALFRKKAFFMGCEFALSFLMAILKKDEG